MWGWGARGSGSWFGGRSGPRSRRGYRLGVDCRWYRNGESCSSLKYAQRNLDTDENNSKNDERYLLEGRNKTELLASSSKTI